MAQADVKKLDKGDLFPTVELRLVRGSMLAVPSGVDGYTVLLIYRGDW